MFIEVGVSVMGRETCLTLVSRPMHAHEGNGLPTFRSDFRLIAMHGVICSHQGLQSQYQQSIAFSCMLPLSNGMFMCRIVQEYCPIHCVLE